MQESQLSLTNAEHWKLIDLVNQEILRKQDCVLADDGLIQPEEMRLRYPVLMALAEKLLRDVSPRAWKGKTMTVEERKMSRPDSRWKAELLNLYRIAESNRSQTTDESEHHYQTGVMMSCLSIWHRVTGEQLVRGAAG